MSGWNFSEIYSVVAQELPQSVALIQGARHVTWADIDRRANGIAAWLVGAGLRRQANVTQYLHNAPEYLESVIAAFHGGFVPMNTNFRYGPAELTYLWTNGDVEAVFFHGTFSSAIEAMRADVPRVRAWLWVDDGSGPCPDWALPYEAAAATVAKPGWRPWPVDGDDLMLLYTGGTTGMPKGVMWRQDDLFVRLNTENEPGFPEAPDFDYLRAHISRSGRPHLSAGPLMHGAGLLTCFLTLSRGGAISHLEQRRFDPVDLLDTVDRDRVASLMWVGDAFARPVLEQLDRSPGRWDLSSLRTIISSGVVFSADIKEAILRHLPHVAIADVFGSSETMSLGRSVTSREKRTRTAAFRPKAQTRVIREDGTDIAPGSGERGLLAIGGRQPVGYYNDPAKTSAVFREIDGQRYVVAGDWATVDTSGVVTLVGRGSECVNTGGEKVFPEEVEIALKAHPSIVDAVVVGVPHERFGQAIAAVVAPASGSTVDPQEVVSFVRTRIAGYKVPRHLMTLDAIPRGPNGKPDIAAVRDFVQRHLKEMVS